MYSYLRVLLLLPAAVFVGTLATMILTAKASPSPSNPARTIVIGVDLSTSNPLLRDPGFAGKVAARLQPMLTGLAPHSRIVLRSFGSYNSSANNTLSLDFVVAPKTARAEDLAKLITTVIAGIPTMVQQGKLQPQNSTNIVPFLLNISNVVSCSAMPTQIILASDGVEDSQVANLSRRNATLPAPATPPFPGCEELQILGSGRGLNSPGDTERLKGEWAYWAQAAGFRQFQGLNDW